MAKKIAQPRAGVTVANILDYCRKEKVSYHNHDFNHGYNAGLEAVEVFITGFLANPPITRLLTDEEMERVVRDQEAEDILAAKDTLDDCYIPERDSKPLERLWRDIENCKDNQDDIKPVSAEEVKAFRLERDNLNNRPGKI